jgi:hypothetical protein
MEKAKQQKRSEGEDATHGESEPQQEKVVTY